MIKIENLLFCYNPRYPADSNSPASSDVKAFDMSNKDNNTANYKMDFGASYRNWRELRSRELWKALFDSILIIMIEDGVCPIAIHNELKSKLEGYEKHYSELATYQRI
jgi:hypothetical protein